VTRQAHEDLERRILERTAELKDANEALKRAEREATDWKNRYDLVVKSAGLAVYDVDRVTSEVVWGGGAKSVLGLDPSEVNRAGEDWLKLVHPQDRLAVTRRIEASLTTGRSFDVQYRLRHGKDHYRWIHDRGIVAPDSQGRCIRLLGIIQDITQSKLAEDTMREQAALLDQTQDAIMVRDLDNRVLYWNRTAQRLYGWTVGEALGRPIQDLILQGKLGHLPIAHAESLKNGAWSGEAKVFTKAGEELTVQSRWRVLCDQDGAPNSFLITHTDLTGQKMLEAKFLRTQRLESLGALASGIAHDLNNVFTPILMSAQMLGETQEEGTRNKVLGTLASSARRGSNMVKQVLTFSRGLESGPEFVQTRHLVGELERMMRETFPPQVKIFTNLPSDLWLVRGDATQLYQILMNLCINSRDAMPDGGSLTVEARNMEIVPAAERVNGGCQRSPHVSIVVSDTGIGMSPETQKRIFEPFFTTKEPGKGTGLGLSTTLSLVKAHNGWIEVDSKPGTGTRFAIFLPATRSQSAGTTTLAEIPPDGKGELLLVIEDESSIREILKTTLEAHDYEVLLAEEGTEALALYSEHRESIALVVTDIVMPVLDGHATARALRKMNPEIKILAISGQAETINVDRFSGSADITFLAKPFTQTQLLQSIHHTLNPSVRI
jgi:two-component system, cell cycle sensor histidine kinase and response regulator CckA